MVTAETGILGLRSKFVFLLFLDLIKINPVFCFIYELKVDFGHLMKV